MDGEDVYMLSGRGVTYWCGGGVICWRRCDILGGSDILGREVRHDGWERMDMFVGRGWKCWSEQVGHVVGDERDIYTSV